MGRFKFRTYWPLYLLAAIMYGVIGYVVLVAVVTAWRLF